MENLPIVELEAIEPIVLDYTCKWALNNNGETTYFGADIWYDIVESIVAILRATEDTWDSTYGDVNETYLHTGSSDESQRTLTARRFNAVTLNIDKILNNKWRWAVDDSVEKGFLGRARVQGKAQYGEKGADKVYGWYMLELIRVTNLLIGIANGDDEFLVEISEELKSFSDVLALPKILTSAPLPAEIFSETRTNAPLIPGEADKIYVYSKSQTDSHMNLRMAEVCNLLTDKIKTKSCSNISLIAPRPDLMYVMEKSSSNTLDLEMFVGRVMEIGVRSITKNTCVWAEAKSLALLSIHSNDNVCKSTSSVAARTALPLRIVSDESISESSTQLEIMVSRPKMAIAEAKDYSLCSLDMDKIRSKIFECFIKTESFADIEFLEREAVSVSCSGGSKSNVKSVLSFYTPEPEQTWYDPEQTGTNIYIRNAYPQWQEDANVHLDGGVFYQAEQTGTNIYIRSTESLKGV